MPFERSQALKKLPPYLFIEIDKKKKAARAAGVDLVDLGVGDPDKPTPKLLLNALAKASKKPENHQYPFGSGMPAFRDQISVWFKKRFGVALDSATEICATIGSKEAIGHFPLAFVNPGDVVLCPDPGYPVYEASTNFVGGEIVRMPLLEKNKFLPDLDAIPLDKLKRAKLLWLNSPNNPTAAVAPLSYLKKAVEFCKQHGLILAHDMAYSEIYYGNRKPASVLEVPGAKEVAIEFHSLSKTFNMTGWRVGFAAGDASLISGLAAVKGNLDSGVVSAIQEMAIAALKAPASLTAGIRKIYEKRRKLMVKALRDAGFELFEPEAAFYLWIKVPKGFTSAEFCTELLEKAGIVATPGNGFGPSGEGYFRLTLTAPNARLKLAIKRLSAYTKGADALAKAMLGLGSNIEPRQGYLRLGLAALNQEPCALLAQSSLYETEPMDVLDQAPFLNMAALIETSLEPQALLERLQAIEAQAHKQVLVRRGPRTLDLDLWYYEAQVFESETLILPHPKIEERPFVLIPMAEIAPDWRHPRSGLRAQELLDALLKPWPGVKLLGSL